MPSGSVPSDISTPPVSVCPLYAWEPTISLPPSSGMSVNCPPSTVIGWPIVPPLEFMIESVRTGTVATARVLLVTLTTGIR